MKKIEKRTVLCLILAAALVAGLGVFCFKFVFQGGNWVSFAANRHLYNSSGQLTVGRVLDRNGDVLSWAEEDGTRTYYDGGPNHRRAILHAVGDPAGRIGTGALVAFADKLSGYNLLTGTQTLSGQDNDLTLTIDDELNYTAYMALNGRKGAVGVYNYRTGEVVCMVSSPTFDPLDPPTIEESDSRYEGVYLNRFLSSTFTPGSVFKTVTLAAAIDHLDDLFARTWTCTGSTQVGDGVVTCPRAHGELDIQGALTHSCNGVFALLAAELGADTMTQYVQKAGLTSSYTVSGLSTAAGRYDVSTASDYQLGWSGVGQYTDSVNPCAVMVYMGAIANGGRAAVPQLILSTRGALGINTSPYLRRSTGRLLDQDTADTIAQMMVRNVTDYYGSSRFPAVTVGAKSGTAEVGSDQSPHAWFAGFVLDEDYPYAFAVLVENGGSGADAAGSVAAAVLDALVNGTA